LVDLDASAYSIDLIGAEVKSIKFTKAIDSVYSIDIKEMVSSVNLTSILLDSVDLLDSISLVDLVNLVNMGSADSINVGSVDSVNVGSVDLIDSVNVGLVNSVSKIEMLACFKFNNKLME
ncbi:6963_t:CDS:1, partial [Cetraspora pellucida]